MLVLLIGAIICYKERMLFSDASLISFLRINFELQLPEKRYGAFITQIVPYIAPKLHLSLRTILIAYSASFNLFYLTVTTLLVYKYQQYSMAILMSFYYVLFVSDSWYWTNNEVHQGIAWMFLFFAIAFSMAKKKTKWFTQIPIFIFLAALAVFTHPLIIISIFALWIFFFIDKTTWYYSKQQTVLYSCLLLAIVGIKYYLSREQAYDSWKMHYATYISFVDIFNAFKGAYAGTFWHDCFFNYWLSLIIFITGIIILIKEKKSLILLWTLWFSIGYFIIVCRTFGPDAYDYHNRFYMESEWALLSLFISAPFVFYFLPRLTNIKASLLLVAIFATRIIYIAIAYPLFHQRVEFTENALAQMRKKGLAKVILKKDKRIEDKLLTDWALCFESILTSKLHGDKPQLSFLVLPEDDLKHYILPDNKKMASIGGSESLRNDFYFQIDTTKSYEVLTYDQLFAK